MSREQNEEGDERFEPTPERPATREVLRVTLEGLSERKKELVEASNQRRAIIVWDELNEALQASPIDLEDVESRAEVMRNPEENQDPEFIQTRENAEARAESDEEASPSLGRRVADEAGNFIPFIGGGKMFVESLVGRQSDGTHMDGKERLVHGVVGVGSVALDFFTAGAGSAVGKGMWRLGARAVGREAAEGVARVAVREGAERVAGVATREAVEGTARSGGRSIGGFIGDAVKEVGTGLAVGRTHLSLSGKTIPLLESVAAHALTPPRVAEYLTQTTRFLNGSRKMRLMTRGAEWYATKRAKKALGWDEVERDMNEARRA